MLINVREYSVLEAPINQSFDGCKENSKATLYVMQRDTGFMFIPVKKKYAEVRCDLTGKKIRKRKWNDQTKTAVKDLLAQHKVSKTGWYILLFLLLSTVGMFLYSIFSIIMSSPRFNTTFGLKTATEKTELLSKLGEGDLIKTTDFVYKITSISKDHITVIKSSVANASNGEYVDPYSPIDENKHSFNSESEININPNAFWQQHSVNPNSDYGGELIFNILDK
jgi:hypothetical protein